MESEPSARERRLKSAAHILGTTWLAVRFDLAPELGGFWVGFPGLVDVGALLGVIIVFPVWLGVGAFLLHKTDLKDDAVFFVTDIITIPLYLGIMRILSVTEGMGM